MRAVEHMGKTDVGIKLVLLNILLVLCVPIREKTMNMIKIICLMVLSYGAWGNTLTVTPNNDGTLTINSANALNVIYSPGGCTIRCWQYFSVNRNGYLYINCGRAVYPGTTGCPPDIGAGVCNSAAITISMLERYVNRTYPWGVMNGEPSPPRGTFKITCPTGGGGDLPFQFMGRWCSRGGGQYRLCLWLA